MKPAGVLSDTIVIDGQRIHYYHAGQSGTPLVLLHGGGVDAALISWGELILPLAAEHRVFAPDLPGYGQSEKPDVTYSLEFYVDFLAKFLDAMHIETPSLAGLSLGGGIALGFALCCPQRLHKLVLVDTYGIQSHVPYHKLSYLYVFTPLNEFSYWFLSRSRDYIRQSLLRGIYDPQNITEALVDEVYRASLDPAAGKAFISFQRDELRWNGLKSDFTPRLRDIRSPTLILHGDQDVIVPVACAQRAHELIPDSRLVILKNRRHWALRDKPAEIVALMLAFLREGDDGAVPDAPGS